MPTIRLAFIECPIRFASELWEPDRRGFRSDRPSLRAGVTPKPAAPWVPAFPTEQVRGLKAHGTTGWSLLRGFLGAGGNDLFGRPAGQLGHVVELAGEAADAECQRAQLDDQIVQFVARQLRPNDVP